MIIVRRREYSTALLDIYKWIDIGIVVLDVGYSREKTKNIISKLIYVKIHY